MVAISDLNRCLECGASTFNTYCARCTPRIVRRMIAPRRAIRAHQQVGRPTRTHLADGRVRCPECKAKPYAELECSVCRGKGWVR